MPETLFGSTGGVLAVLCAVCAFWFYVAQITELKLFNYAPPLLFIYTTPIILNNAVVSYGLVHPWLSSDAWKRFASLAGSRFAGTYDANRGAAAVH